MIDDKKIEEAALGYCAKCSDITNRNVDLDEDECVDLHNGFIDGAKWMQEEFLKNLWHPASEEPEKNHFVLFKTAGNSFETEYIGKNDWATIVRCFKVVKWFYVDDLLPKKGGEK